ncbi:hypothetical protein HO133_006720 [Letharia lupina]|uniref:Uncharacterized protein n=1 Tax=Letharia lupina TaxID=560253 RepID=A0A8H6C5R8_9LECA|nr:uncharacterized protein HO133_006720 [Letharia lupina]KAF6217618.1 hypothetical protein HO133_006720 [Letharia lupina]
MKLFLAALALAAVSANTQSLSTVVAPCGTSCPSAAPDKMITRSAPPMETSPCPSLLVSSVAMNATSGVTTGSPTPTHFAGGANHIAGSFGGVALAAAALAFAL